jgi:hypothetical protein
VREFEETISKSNELDQTTIARHDIHRVEKREEIALSIEKVRI